MDVDQSEPQGDVSENRRAAIFGLGIGFIVFDSIVITLRIYVRAFMLRALGTDDSESIESHFENETDNSISPHGYWSSMRPP